VIDIPDATPGPDLHPLTVGHWGVKNVRAALHSSRPPVTRIVVDLDAVQPYQVSTSDNGVIVQLGGSRLISPTQETQVAALPQVPAQQAASPASKVAVSYRAGLLGIHANQATLAEVLNEVHRSTGAEVEIPAGAAQDPIVVDLGPASPSQVLSSLLNGTPFNFILVGSASDPRQLGSVLLTRKDPEQPAKIESRLPTTNVPADSFQNQNKLGGNSSLAAGTAPVPAPQPSASEQTPSQAPAASSSAPQARPPQQPYGLPTDQDLSTPRPVGVDPPPPGV